MSNSFLRVACVLLAILLLGFQAMAAQDSLPPQVIEVQPEPGVELADGEPLMIVFDHPMRPLTISLQFEPLLLGEVTWVDVRTLLFLPENETWPANNRYIVSVTGTATNGLKLEPAYEFEVQSPRSLSVAAVTPEDGTEGVATAGTQITVTFDRPIVPLVSTVDQGTLPRPLTITPAMPGTGEWVNTSAYVFTPSATHLLGNTTYTVTLAAGLTAVDGTVLLEDISWSFSMLAPLVINVDATERFDEKLILLDTAFQIEFSQPMDRETTEAAFRVTDRGDAYYETFGEALPEVEGQIRWDVQNKILTFQPETRLNLRNLYYVELNTSARSATGVAVLAEPVKQHFVTVGAPQATRTYPSGRETLRPGRRGVRFGFNTLMNMSTLEGRYVISPEPEGEVTPYIYSDSTFSLEFLHEVDETYTITLLAGIEDIYGNAT